MNDKSSTVDSVADAEEYLANWDVHPQSRVGGVVGALIAEIKQLKSDNDNKQRILDDNVICTSYGMCGGAQKRHEKQIADLKRQLAEMTGLHDSARGVIEQLKAEAETLGRIAQQDNKSAIEMLKNHNDVLTKDLTASQHRESGLVAALEKIKTHIKTPINNPEGIFVNTYPLQIEGWITQALAQTEPVMSESEKGVE